MRVFKSFAVLVLVAATAAGVAAQKIQINGAGTGDAAAGDAAAAVGSASD